MKIHAAHLFNDFSGSPKVLKQVIENFNTNNSIEILVYTNTNNEGFLSDLKNVNYINIPYSFVSNKFLRLVYFFYNQFLFFIKSFSKISKNDIVYVNTILPFGMALSGKLNGAKIIYHIHETSISPLIFKNFLKFIVSITANKIIYVSQFLKNKEKFEKINSEVIYNAIEISNESEILNLIKLKSQDTQRKVVMLCSLKEYKGINPFIELAFKMENINFLLVLNTSQKEIDKYFETKELPQNLQIFSTQKDTNKFYNECHVVLNLSLPDQWIETFGLTILEGMSRGCPAIVPPLGGITELVTDNLNGFKISSYSIEKIISKLDLLLGDKFVSFAQYALYNSYNFSLENFNQKIENSIFKTINP